MCNGRVFPAWQADAIRKLADVSGVEIALLIIKDGQVRSAPSRYARLADLPHLLWTLFNKGYVERRSAASRAVDLENELGAVPDIRCRTIPEGKYGERFSDEDLENVESHNLDLILRFSFGIIRGAILKSATYGVWSFHHGDERHYRGQPPGFWELMDDENVVGSILQRLTDRLDAGVVLYRGHFRATSHSYRRTRDDIFFGSSDWPSLVARQIQAGDMQTVTAEPSSTDAPVKRSPTNWQTLTFLMRQARDFITSQWRGLTKAAKWTVGVADVPIESFLSGDLPPIKWVAEQGRTRYLADPFGIDTDSGLIVLAEDYDHKEHRGVISALNVDGDETARQVLDVGVHASYPYTFTQEDTIYCVPEAYQTGQVGLYKATRFPDEWELVGSLLDDVKALDPTVFQHQDRWWLFCSLHGSDSNTKLHVYHAPNLEGPWESHWLNPVKTDIRSSRPAGTPFTHEGDLYRPAQDGSSSYGGGVTITRIDELTPERFSEVVVATITPSPSGKYKDGIHTISAAGSRTVVDGRRDTFILASGMRELGSRMDRIFGKGA